MKNLLHLSLSDAVGLATPPGAPAHIRQWIDQLPDCAEDPLRAMVIILAALRQHGQSEVLPLVLNRLPDNFALHDEVAATDADRGYAEQLLKQLHDWLRQLMESGDIDSPIFISYARMLACFATQYRLAVATPLLQDARSAASHIQDVVNVALCDAGLAELLAISGNWRGAAAHYVHAANALAGTPHTKPLEWLLHYLLQFAKKLYYQAQDYQACVNFLQQVMPMAGDSHVTCYLLGNAYIKLGQLELAVAPFTTLSERQPSAMAFGNLATILAGLGRHPEALALLDRSLQMEPDKLHSLMQRAQLRIEAGSDPAVAIADLLGVLDQLEQRPPAEQLQFDDLWKMWWRAYQALIQLYRQQDDTVQLARLVVRLKNTCEAALIALGHHLDGELAQAAGQHELARLAYAEALRQYADDYPSHLAMARLEANLGHGDAALAALAAIVSRDRSPAVAIEDLKQLQQRYPGKLDISRWLGIACYKCYHFADAERYLTAYLAHHPDDIEARRWLGMSATSMPIEPNDRHLGGDHLRLHQGLDALATAAAAGDTPARETLTWLLDRLLPAPEYFFHIVAMDSIASAFPTMRPMAGMLLRSSSGSNCTPAEYTERAELLVQCIDCVREAGLTCFAIYLHSHLADLHMQRGDLQAASDAAHIAQDFTRLAMAPRLPELQQQARAMMAERDTDDVLAAEQEYMHIYACMQTSLMDLQLILGRVFIRTGDAQAARRQIFKLEQLMEHARTLSPPGTVLAAELLRDLGFMAEAAMLLDHADERAENDEERGRVVLAKAGLAGRRGQSEEAMRLMREAAPLLNEKRRWLCWLNLALASLNTGHPEDTLKYLAQIDIEAVARTADDSYEYYNMQASALQQLDRAAEAFPVARQALAVIESLRTEFKDLELRAHWAKRAGDAYLLAVSLALDVGDLVEAFNLSEKSRSRQLIDEMAIGHLQPTAAAQVSQARIAKLEAQKHLLLALQQAARGSTERAELLVKLQTHYPALHPSEAVVPDDVEISRETIQELLEKIDNTLVPRQLQLLRERVHSAEKMFGTVQDYQQVVALLGSARMRNTAVIQLLVLEAEVLAFIVKPHQPAPRLVRLPIDQNRLADWTRGLLASMQSSAPSNTEESPLSPLLHAIEEETKADDVLYFIPHGHLHQVPFHALMLADGQALIRRNAVAYAPSISVLADIAARGDSEHTPGAIVVGDSQQNLPYALSEAHAVAGLMGVTAITGHHATRRSILDALSATSKVRSIHLACHGYVDRQDPLASGVVTAADNSATDGLRVLRARDFLDCKLTADLITVSACESGIGELREGDEMIGLPRALLVSGAASVIASTWKVDDLSTSILMRTFYSAWLTEQLPKAQALRKAQCLVMDLTAELLRANYAAPGQHVAERDLVAVAPQSPSAGAGHPFKAPYHWASFRLTGDWT